MISKFDRNEACYISEYYTSISGEDEWIHIIAA